MKKKIIIISIVINIGSFIFGSVFTIWTVVETQLKHNAFISLSIYKLLSENDQEKAKKLQAMCFIGKIKTIETIDKFPLSIFFINDWFYPRNRYENILKDKSDIEKYWLKNCQTGVGGDEIEDRNN